MIELCYGRMGIIKYDEETLLREAKDISLNKLKLAIKEVSFFMILNHPSLPYHVKDIFEICKIKARNAMI